MKKLLLSILMFLNMFLFSPLWGQEIKKNPTKDSNAFELSLSINGDTVRVINAEIDSQLEVYNVLGVKVFAIKIDSSDKTVHLNLPKGCYIIKIKDIARKIAVK